MFGSNLTQVSLRCSASILYIDSFMFSTTPTKMGVWVCALLENLSKERKTLRRRLTQKKWTEVYMQDKVRSRRRKREMI